MDTERVEFISHITVKSKSKSGRGLGILTKQASCTLNDDTITGNVVKLFRLKITSNYFKYWRSWSRDLTRISSR